MEVKIIAYYLPQYHPNPDNDRWWGKGFTEWTNVGKAKKLFKGHQQPKVPADLGYYDLRLPQIREEQVKLAKEAGVYGFCYWHYWFGNKERLLQDVFDEVLKSGRPDFPFCLGWANHSWYAKKWNSEGVRQDKLLKEQKYLGEEDAREHFEFLVKAFKDKRYIKIGNKPYFLIFDPVKLPELYIKLFKKWAREAGFDGLFLVANVPYDGVSKDDMLKKGYDAVVYHRLVEARYKSFSKFHKLIFQALRNLRKILFGKPVFAEKYKDVFPYLINYKEDCKLDVIPTIVPSWDHTPRSGINGSLFLDSNPKYFEKLSQKAIEVVKCKPEELQIIMLKSWNEWGEGNYMEPDIVNGKGYINALRRALDSFDL